MRNFRVVSGELVFSSGSLETVSGRGAVRQAIECRLRTFRGEWFLDGSIGVPYFDGILGTKNPALDAVRSVLRQEILSVPGVIRLVSLEIDLERSARRLTASFVVSSDEGLVEGSI